VGKCKYQSRRSDAFGLVRNLEAVRDLHTDSRMMGAPGRTAVIELPMVDSEGRCYVRVRARARVRRS